MIPAKSRKGSWITGVIAVAVVIAALSVTIERVGGEFVWSTRESFNLYNKYFTLKMDKEIQSLKQGFEKTAAFFSLNSVTKELAEHGGYAQDTLKDDNINNIADSTETQEPEIRIKDGLPLWTIPDCETTLKRVPYLKDEDINLPAADTLITIMSNDINHLQYIDEINSGKYPLYVSIQIFMTKPGTVTVECRDIFGCEIMAPLEGTPAIIEKDGIYFYKIEKVKRIMPLMLRITGRDAEGEIVNVARIKQVTASIYNPAETIITPGYLFTDRLLKYHANMESALQQRNEELEIKLKISPLKGTMTKGKEGFVEGIVWPDEDADSITSDMDNPFFKDNRKLAELRDSGIVTEETKLRYYVLYDYAVKFTDIQEDLIKYRLWYRLNYDLEDTSDPENSFCDYSLCPPGCNNCPDDTVSTYDKSDFQTAIQNELDNIKSDLDATANAAEITWTLTLKDFDTASIANPANYCDTNKLKTACSQVETCNSKNLEHHEYKSGKITSGGCCQCNAAESSCTGPFGSVNSGSYKPDCKGARETTCTMQYRHRYVLKNLKIEVTITDEAYKYYNTETNTWDNQQFRFYVSSPLIDDNCCDWKSCSDMVSECEYPETVEINF